MGKPPWRNFIEKIYNNGLSIEIVEEYKEYFPIFNVILDKPGKFMQINDLFLDFEREPSKDGIFFTTNATFQPVLSLLEYQDLFNTFHFVPERKNNEEEMEQTT